jgi:hypothetical protein
MLLVVGAMIFSAFKLLPPYIRNYQLQDSINNIARTSTYSKAGEETIRNDVIKAAHDAGVTLEPSQVRVDRGRVTVDIAADYSVTVDMLVKPVTMHFTPSAGNRIITAK